MNEIIFKTAAEIFIFVVMIISGIVAGGKINKQMEFITSSEAAKDELAIIYIQIKKNYKIFRIKFIISFALFGVSLWSCLYLRDIGGVLCIFCLIYFCYCAGQIKMHEKLINEIEEKYKSE